MTPYQEYLLTDWWHDLRENYIGQNPKAKCWICGRREALLLHHVTYENLYSERMGRDLFIICFGKKGCHMRIHFKLRTGEKIKLEKQILLKRMWMLKITHPIRTFRLGTMINNIGHFIASGLD